MLAAVARFARGDQLAWLERIIDEMAELFSAEDSPATLEYLRTL